MLFSIAIALAAIAVALCTLMAVAWMVQQQTGNSGWVDTIWTFSVGMVGVGAALWPFSAHALPARQWMVAALVLAWAMRLGLHIAVRSAGSHDDPRYAEYAKHWGAAAPRKMFVFLQQQALGSIPLVFAIFLAAQTPVDQFRFQDYLGAVMLFAGIAGRAWPMRSCGVSVVTQPTRAECAMSACGAGRGTRTISFSGSAGSLIR